MFKENYNVVGVMSGTSLDGLDIAHIQLQLVEGKWSFEILEAETLAYDSIMANRLQKAIFCTADELTTLDVDYSLYLSTSISKFLKKHHLHHIDAVCSHGHTVLHQPAIGLTHQIGNLTEIKTHIKPLVVCNFRIQDVQLGGQGAPLVPIGDRLLFSNFNYCLNLGGFSNISFETASGRIAFDISPVNTVLNHYMQLIGKAFDDGGSLASSGQTNKPLFNQLNSNPYYNMGYPKSLGVEFVVAQVIPLIDSYQLPLEDILHTYVAHIAYQIAAVITKKQGTLLITGGGAYNLFLVDCLQKALPEMIITVPESKIIEFKEALIFGLLGTLKIRNEINVLSSVTGAKHDHCAGFIYY